MWKIVFSRKAEKELDNLPLKIQDKIVDFLYDKARFNPKISGSFLQGSLKNTWRYKVGDYRILCHHHGQTLEVYVVQVGHRQGIYK